MNIEEDLEILQEFTELDRKLRNYKVESDYDNFCERRCVAIDHILAEREADKKKIDKLQVLEDDLKDKRIVYVDTPEFEKEFIPTQKVLEEIDKVLEAFRKVEFNRVTGWNSLVQLKENLLGDK